jgi:hypothetical protein
MPKQVEECVSALLAEWASDPSKRPAAQDGHETTRADKRSQAYAICTARYNETHKSSGGSMDPTKLNAIFASALGQLPNAGSPDATTVANHQIFSAAFAAAVQTLTAGMDDPAQLPKQLRANAQQLNDLAALVEAAFPPQEEDKDKPKDEKPKE